MDQQQLDLLKRRDYTFILDKSGSVGSNYDTPSKQSRWKYMRETATAVTAKFNEIDTDGMTFYLFSNNHIRKEGVTPDQIEALFDKTEPGGSTNLAGVLKDATDNYFARRAKGQTKPDGEFLMVLTDGEPDSQEDVVKVIVDATKKVSSSKELSITFVQVGRDEKAKAFLKKLDDDLTRNGAVHDIVSAITLEEMGDRNLSDVIISAVTESKIH